MAKSEFTPSKDYNILIKITYKLNSRVEVRSYQVSKQLHCGDGSNATVTVVVEVMQQGHGRRGGKVTGS